MQNQELKKFETRLEKTTKSLAAHKPSIPGALPMVYNKYRLADNLVLTHKRSRTIGHDHVAHVKSIHNDERL